MGVLVKISDFTFYLFLYQTQTYFDFSLSHQDHMYLHYDYVCLLQTLIFSSLSSQINRADWLPPENHSITFLDNGALRTESQITSFTFLENETKLNDDKRNINILKPIFLGIFLENIADIMEYKPSKQFIHDKLKKTENPRIISP